MEQIIQKAIAGGWKNYLFTDDVITRIDVDSSVDDGKFYVHYTDGISNTSDMWTLSFYQMFLDPLFWQALGKNCGWEDEPVYRMKDGEIQKVMLKGWHKKWLKFIDEIAFNGWHAALEYLTSITK